MSRDIKFRARNKATGNFLKQSYNGQCFYWINCGHQESIVIEQFVGFKDSEGVELYEGDIITDNVGTAVINFKECAFKVSYTGKNKGSGKYFFDYLTSELKTIRKIGNIHENPELLSC